MHFEHLFHKKHSVFGYFYYVPKIDFEYQFRVPPLRFGTHQKMERKMILEFFCKFTPKGPWCADEERTFICWQGRKTNACFSDSKNSFAKSWPIFFHKLFKILVFVLSAAIVYLEIFLVRSLFFCVRAFSIEMTIIDKWTMDGNAKVFIGTFTYFRTC